MQKSLGGVTMKKLLIASAVAAGTILGVSGQASAACGTVSIAEMNWASAQLLANVDKIIFTPSNVLINIITDGKNMRMSLKDFTKCLYFRFRVD